MSEVVHARDFDDADADARLAAIVDSSFDAIIGKDLNSVITSWNGAAERLFGYSAEETIGRSVLMLIPERLHGEEDEIIAKIRRGESVPPFETIRRRKDGRDIFVSLTISPIRNRAGQIIGASKIARDISEARASDRRIKLLLREVNHRIKNQFAVILSMIRETAKHTKDPREFERSIRERITALASSHDLLVTSDWSGGSLHELLRQQLQPFSQDGQIGLEGPEMTLRPVALQALGMAFHELATNSAKYGAFGHHGTVSISLSLSGKPYEQVFQLGWEEKAGSIVESAAHGHKARGFGSVVLLRVAPQTLNGSAHYDRSRGVLRWLLSAPAAAVIGDGDSDETSSDKA
ncbi:MAG: PAS domain S-box protein [Rhizobiales bacterium]|nr:PAS domain S-box protein [Hyphomicrobiales bacterium]